MTRSIVLILVSVLGANALEPEQIKVGSATIDVTYGDGSVDLPPVRVRKWIADAAEAVRVYYGTFPVPQVKLRVLPAPGRSGVFRGTTWGREFGSLTRLSLGEKTTSDELTYDWMLTHELVHTGFPSVDDEHHWIEEGIATYVEPIARVQAGQISEARIWSDMVRDMHQGEPAEGDQGLDHTHTWARTYWGGALFCLVADVQIRERTKNRKGLQDALRAIVGAGGNIREDWAITRAFQVGDQATGTKVLSDLYAKMKDAPSPVDLDVMWKQLGIERKGETVVFNNAAPLAKARIAITAKPKTAS